MNLTGWPGLTGEYGFIVLKKTKFRVVLYLNKNNLGQLY